MTIKLTQEQAEVANAICERIAGGKSLRSICEGEREGDNLYGYPHESTFRKWVRNNDNLHTQYARACGDRADVIFDECIDIADRASNETVAVARLRIDSRKWAVGKMKPGKYGESVRQEISGKDGGPIEVSPASKLTDFINAVSSRKSS